MELYRAFNHPFPTTPLGSSIESKTLDRVTPITIQISRPASGTARGPIVGRMESPQVLRPTTIQIIIVANAALGSGTARPGVGVGVKGSSINASLLGGRKHASEGLLWRDRVAHLPVCRTTPRTSDSEAVEGTTPDLNPLTRDTTPAHMYAEWLSTTSVNGVSFLHCINFSAGR
ncbi:hypothetical protein CROQUDRAFT_93451 [Cronartium quercuum f. sp. fusiforme G11]|uniref:Uncharacterized protein n=1 Tax=Cronartium quercuum f. sp. fusiforme G11 TaxID=708437 RepID=A0A9P6NGR9_9BASI|nr:hypothetical protein CROQUDRAFT_93451 [Cronartium quercuum f. sp. fusiforme G11]